MLCRGGSLGAAVDTARALLLAEPRHGGTLAAVDAALADRGEPPRAELVETLGAGWTGDAALAIGLYCALVARDFVHGVLLTVNHSGDSDSTGSIGGNILGAARGAAAIPAAWLAKLELRAVIERVAGDRWRHFAADPAFTDEAREADWRRYPGSERLPRSPLHHPPVRHIAPALSLCLNVASGTFCTAFRGYVSDSCGSFVVGPSARPHHNLTNHAIPRRTQP